MKRESEEGKDERKEEDIEGTKCMEGGRNEQKRKGLVVAWKITRI